MNASSRSLNGLLPWGADGRVKRGGRVSAGRRQRNREEGRAEMGGSTRSPGVLQRDDASSQVRARALGNQEPGPLESGVP